MDELETLSLRIDGRKQVVASELREQPGTQTKRLLALCVHTEGCKQAIVFGRCERRGVADVTGGSASDVSGLTLIMVISAGQARGESQNLSDDFWMLNKDGCATLSEPRRCGDEVREQRTTGESGKWHITGRPRPCQVGMARAARRRGAPPKGYNVEMMRHGRTQRHRIRMQYGRIQKHYREYGWTMNDGDAHYGVAVGSAIALVKMDDRSAAAVGVYAGQRGPVGARRRLWTRQRCPVERCLIGAARRRLARLGACGAARSDLRSVLCKLALVEELTPGLTTAGVLIEVFVCERGVEESLNHSGERRVFDPGIPTANARGHRGVHCECVASGHMAIHCEHLSRRAVEKFVRVSPAGDIGGAAEEADESRCSRAMAISEEDVRLWVGFAGASCWVTEATETSRSLSMKNTPHVSGRADQRSGQERPPDLESTVAPRGVLKIRNFWVAAKVAHGARVGTVAASQGILTGAVKPEHRAAASSGARWECAIRHAADELWHGRLAAGGSVPRNNWVTSRDAKQEYDLRSCGGEVARSAGERPPSRLSSVASTGVPACRSPAVGAYSAQQIRCALVVCVCCTECTELVQWWYAVGPVGPPRNR